MLTLHKAIKGQTAVDENHWRCRRSVGSVRCDKRHGRIDEQPTIEAEEIVFVLQHESLGVERVTKDSLLQLLECVLRDRLE